MPIAVTEDHESLRATALRWAQTHCPPTVPRQVAEAPPGSARPMARSGFLSRNAMATPASVPPVPTAQMKPSIRPSVWAQISGPVPSIWAWRLATLSNWLAQMTPAGSFAASSSARRPE